MRLYAGDVKNKLWKVKRTADGEAHTIQNVGTGRYLGACLTCDAPSDVHMVATYLVLDDEIPDYCLWIIDTSDTYENE
jgi:hypothetical protein